MNGFQLNDFCYRRSCVQKWNEYKTFYSKKRKKEKNYRKQLLNILYYIYQLVASLLISFKTLQEKIKGVDSILKVLWFWDDRNSLLFFRLIDSQIQPILLYGSEIWGLVLISISSVCHETFSGRLFSDPACCMMSVENTHFIYVHIQHALDTVE